LTVRDCAQRSTFRVNYYDVSSLPGPYPINRTPGSHDSGRGLDALHDEGSRRPTSCDDRHRKEEEPEEVFEPSFQRTTAGALALASLAETASNCVELRCGVHTRLYDYYLYVGHDA